MSRIASLLAASGVALACVGAPVAVAPLAWADPDDLLPLCSGDESPQQDNCGTGCPENAPANGSGSCAEPGTQIITGGPADDVGTVAIFSGSAPKQLL